MQYFNRGGMRYFWFRKSGLHRFLAALLCHVFLDRFHFCIAVCRQGKGSINGTVLKDRAMPGPVTARLTAAYRELVGFDFVEQYFRHLHD